MRKTERIGNRKEGSIKYDFKCSQCGNIEEVFISMAIILHKGVIVDKDELQKKIDEERFCECGGKFKRIYSTKPLDFIYIPENCDYISNGSTHRILQKGGTSEFHSKLRS